MGAHALALLGYQDMMALSELFSNSANVSPVSPPMQMPQTQFPTPPAQPQLDAFSPIVSPPSVAGPALTNAPMMAASKEWLNWLLTHESGVLHEDETVQV